MVSLRQILYRSIYRLLLRRRVLRDFNQFHAGADEGTLWFLHKHQTRFLADRSKSLHSQLHVSTPLLITKKSNMKIVKLLGMGLIKLEKLSRSLEAWFKKDDLAH